MSSSEKGWKELETERLVLRMFCDKDVDAYARICANPEVTRFIGGGNSTRPEVWRSLAMLLGHWSLRGYGMWAVEERASGELIGRVGLFNPEGWPGIELSWMLRQESWGFGFATEGARAALAHTFTDLKIPHIISLIDPENVASIRVAERLGQRLEERIEFREHEMLVYGIGREEFEKTKG